ncbi:MAG: hypothetical protein ACI9W4_000882 [Rhodothermales bacterium]|jgi:hypothetical protein
MPTDREHGRGQHDDDAKQPQAGYHHGQQGEEADHGAQSGFVRIEALQALVQEVRLQRCPGRGAAPNRLKLLDRRGCAPCTYADDVPRPVCKTACQNERLDPIVETLKMRVRDYTDHLPGLLHASGFLDHLAAEGKAAPAIQVCFKPHKRAVSQMRIGRRVLNHRADHEIFRLAGEPGVHHLAQGGAITEVPPGRRLGEHHRPRRAQQFGCLTLAAGFGRQSSDWFESR